MSKVNMGRALDLLIPDDPDALREAVEQIPVDQIDADPGQPRQTFDKEEMQELIDSVKEKGVQQPIGVRPAGERYTIIWGERRWRASKQAGRETVPALVKDVDEGEAYELALIENLQRADLDPLDEAAGIQGLMNRRNYNQETAAKRLGFSKSKVSKLLKINGLSDSVRKIVSPAKLGIDHLYEIAREGKGAAQQARAMAILKERPSREAMRTKSREKGGGGGTRQPGRPKDSTPPLVRDMRRIREKLGKELPGKWKAADKEALRQEIAAWREQLEKLEGGL